MNRFKNLTLLEKLIGICVIPGLIPGLLSWRIHMHLSKHIKHSSLYVYGMHALVWGVAMYLALFSAFLVLLLK